MKKIYEIREYSQELRVDKYDIEDVYAGITFMGDFSNKDYEVVKTFDSLDDAIKEFEKYESYFRKGFDFRNPHIFTEYTITEVLTDDECECIDDEYVKISELPAFIKLEKKFYKINTSKIYNLKDLQEEFSKNCFYNKNLIEEVKKDVFENENTFIEVKFEFEDSYEYIEIEIELDTVDSNNFEDTYILNIDRIN